MFGGLKLVWQKANSHSKKTYKLPYILLTSSLWPQQWHHRACHCWSPVMKSSPPCRRGLPFICHLTPAFYLPLVSLLSPLTPPMLPLIDPHPRCIEYQCSRSTQPDLWPPPEAPQFPPTSGRAHLAELTECQVAHYALSLASPSTLFPFPPTSHFGPTQFPAGAADGALPRDKGEERRRWETHVE